MAECLITGIVADLSGNPAISAEITFQREGRIIAFDGSVRLPDEITATTDSAGNISVSLVPGYYRVSFGNKAVRIGVPEAATADFADLVGEPAPVTNTIAAQALQYRNEALAAANSITGGPVFDSVSALLADTAMTYSTGSSLSVVAGASVVTRADGFAYTVAAAGATDQDLTTAGGVKLYAVSRNGYWNVLQFGAVGNGSVNDAPAIQKAINKASSGHVVFLPSGTYNIGATLNADGKSIRFVGSAASLGMGTRIVRTANIKMLSWRGTPSGFIQIGGIDHIEFAANATTYTADVIEIAYATTGTFTNLSINQVTTGAGLYLGQGFQDNVFTRLFIRGAGSASRGMVHMAPPDAINGNLNVNDNRFLGCHFEQNGGNYGTQVYIDWDGASSGTNNSNVFTACKFESAMAGTNPLVCIVNGSRNQWIGCRFTNYNLAFSVSRSEILQIDGVAWNSSLPSARFANLQNVDTAYGTVNGRFVGGVLYSGASVRCDFRTVTKGEVSNVTSGAIDTMTTEVVSASDKFGKSYLRFFPGVSEGKAIVDDSAEFTASALRGNSVDFGQVLRVVPSNVSRHRDGMTLNFRAKSTTSKSYEVRARGASLDVVVSTPTIGTSYAWYSVSFTPDQCANQLFSMQINNSSGMGSDFLTISEFYVDDVFLATAAPTSGTWETGATVFNRTPTAGGKIGWVCVSGGSPGTWKAFGAIDP